MERKKAKALIDRVRRGADATQVVETFVDADDRAGLVSNRIAVCLRLDCGYKEDLSEETPEACPVCGGVLANFYQESPPVPSNGSGPSDYVYMIPEADEQPITKENLKLGHLRPNDRFRFEKLLPFKTIDPLVDYVVVPAPKGYICFADGSDKLFRLRLDLSFVYPVLVDSGIQQSVGRKFYKGDRVVHKVNGDRGEVWRAHGTTCLVKFGDDDPVTINSTLLSLVDKDDTTENYIQKDGKGWVVKFADYETRHPTHLDALKALHRDHRTAFYRYSKWLTSDPGSPMDEAQVKYLASVDPKVWGNRR